MDFSKLIYSIKQVYIRVTTSIAFYPIMISLGLLILAWVISYVDKEGYGEALLNEVPSLKINNADTARSLLSGLLTGLITLVTFTFAMVMIVLAQVTSSFSPRLLPDLVSTKGNQVVMGSIIGAICFIMVALSNVETMPSGPEVPVLSVFMGMLLGFASLIAFIFFIHKISNEIQIGNISSTLYHTTRNVLDIELKSKSYQETWEEKEEFYLVNAWESGYFDTITHKDFLKESRKVGLKLQVLKIQGDYLLQGEPFVKINKPLTEKIKEILEQNVVFRHQENVDENLFYGFKHLTEIAVKALSPGINDPATALQAINYLTDLLCRLQQLTGQKVVRHDDGTDCIIYPPVPFQQILYLCIASIRAYSATDIAVQTRLVELLSKVSKHDKEDKHLALIEEELTSIEEASAEEMKSKSDVEYVRSLVGSARKKQT